MSKAQVVIIGGGVIGAAIAWRLTELGVTDVELLEKKRLASGATGVCPGGLRQQFEGEADCLLAQHSLRFYEQINERLAPESPFTIERSGYLFLAESEERLDRFRDNIAMQNRIGIPSEVVTPADIQRLAPALRLDGVIGGAFCAEDGFLEDCHGVTFAFASRARARGVRVAYEEVTRLAPGGPGWHVWTAERRIEAEHVVMAAGADSLPLLAPHVALPIRPERRRLAYSAAAEPGQLNPLTVDLGRGFAGKQLLSGVFYLGWIGEAPEEPDLVFIEETLTRGLPILPILEELPIRHVMSGIYDNTPDHRPLLGAVDGFDRLWLAVGFSGHGFMIAPAVAEIVAHAICDRPTLLPAGAFTLARFAGRRIEEGLFI